MKKQLFDLTIEEFVWVLFNMQKPYIVEWKTFPRSNGDEIEMRGTYTQIHDILMDVWAKNPKNEYAQKLIKQFEDKFFDYDMELSPLDIYNYLDEKTKGFDHERCKAILNQMEVCRFMEIDEEMQEEIYRRLGKGMIRLKHVKIFDKILKKEEEDIDYKDAYRQIYGYAYDFAYYEAIGILESKIAPELVRNKECSGRELQNAKPQQKRKSARSKGRPKETLKDKMINDADGSKLQKVHTVMNGKIGKEAALIILACIKKGWMLMPTFTQVAEEFGDIGTQQGFTNYLHVECFTNGELEGAINSLD